MSVRTDQLQEMVSSTVAFKANRRNKFITISTDPTDWGDTSAIPDFNINDAVQQIRDAAESQGIEVLTDESPRFVCNVDGSEKDNVDWFTTWCSEGYLWMDWQWRKWFAAGCR